MYINPTNVADFKEVDEKDVTMKVESIVKEDFMPDIQLGMCVLSLEKDNMARFYPETPHI